ncbi:MAG: monovalent cation/H(+) antiporter subunit G [Gemmatimonadota bacterium]|nr:monovalent cation/H(+) antiporter subunit G [Gemmatimonadota bacterium]
MELLVAGLSWILIVGGVVFLIGGAIGVNRMPDVFTRQHAGGMTDTAGAGLMVLGMMLQTGFSLNTLRLLIVIIFVLFTSPIATHATCRAALEGGLVPVRRKEDGTWTS